MTIRLAKLEVFLLRFQMNSDEFPRDSGDKNLITPTKSSSSVGRELLTCLCLPFALVFIFAVLTELQTGS